MERKSNEYGNDRKLIAPVPHSPNMINSHRQSSKLIKRKDLEEDFDGEEDDEEDDNFFNMQ